MFLGIHLSLGGAKTDPLCTAHGFQAPALLEALTIIS